MAKKKVSKHWTEDHARHVLEKADRSGLSDEEAGLKVEGPHILRHTFCSHLAMRGVPINTIKNWAGHGGHQRHRTLHAPQPHGDT